MTRYNNPRLITPPREEEEIYPYRRVWPSLTLEMGGLFAVTVVLYVVVGFLGINLPESLWRYSDVGLALLPLALWMIFSLWRERSVPEPRTHLVGIVVITALAANAVAIPLIDALNLDQWFSLTDTFTRIAGYAFTVGIIQEMTKYFVVRFITWPTAYRIRDDAIAYMVSAAIGYVTVVNLRLLVGEALSPDVAILRVFSNTTLHVIVSLIIAYGFAELRFNSKAFLAMPMSLILASLLTGFGITFRAGMVSGDFVLGLGGARPLFGLGFSAALITGGLFVAVFMFNVAERRAREAEKGTDE